MDDRILILTGYSEEYTNAVNGDNSFAEVFELTLPSKLKYAQKHKYDILVLRKFGIDNTNIIEHSNIEAMRCVRALDMLNHYDVVMWIDGDAIITNPSYSIDKFMLDDHSFYASYDWNVDPNTNNYFSFGNFILKNNKNIEQFKSALYNMDKIIPNFDRSIWGNEQSGLNIINKFYNLQNKNIIKILETKYLNSVPSFMGWDSNRHIVTPWTPDSFLAHLTGSSNKNRIDVLVNQLSEYL
jgi:hypothetical protein